MHGGTGVYQAVVKGMRLGIKSSKLPEQENALVNVKSPENQPTCKNRWCQERPGRGCALTGREYVTGVG